MNDPFRCDCGSDSCSTEFDPARGRVRTCSQCGARTTPDIENVARVGQPPTERRAPTEDDVLPERPTFRLTPPPSKEDRRAASKPAPAAAPALEASKPINVVKLARRRLRELNREITKLHKLEKERDELERLIRAADGKPVAVVASIRTAKGA